MSTDTGERDRRRGIEEMARKVREGHAKKGERMTQEQAQRFVVRHIKTEERRQSGG